MSDSLRAVWKRTLIALLAATTMLSFSVGQAAAAPDDDETVTSTVSQKDADTVVISIDQGSLVQEADGLAVRDPQGRLIETVPLQLLDEDGLLYPIKVSAADSRNVTLTRSRNATEAQVAPAGLMEQMRHETAPKPKKQKPGTTKNKKTPQERRTDRARDRIIKKRDNDLAAARAERDNAIATGGLVGRIAGMLIGFAGGCLVGFVAGTVGGLGALGPVVCPLGGAIGSGVGGLAGTGIGMAVGQQQGQEAYDKRSKQIKLKYKDDMRKLRERNGQATPRSGNTQRAPRSAPRAAPRSSVRFKNCDEARRAGAAPIRRGEPGYRPGLDRDGDGVACEPKRR